MGVSPLGVVASEPSVFVGGVVVPDDVDPPCAPSFVVGFEGSAVDVEPSLLGVGAAGCGCGLDDVSPLLVGFDASGEVVSSAMIVVPGPCCFSSFFTSLFVDELGFSLFLSLKLHDTAEIANADVIDKLKVENIDFHFLIILIPLFL
ncbi:Uncharacterised protein [Mycoplasmopsis edwardii]|uniref:Uncharacterized protein n=1 Tax=Mycoplasmopsis edwardii TaxID=53558 RepID=A0A3B0PNK9_9BACT|nr:Uncharacterised protein [Mycoplasmopsis edwardii]